ncbi:DUF1803 domain-containing protein [Candidatus Enterococcus mangumiae]|uniref:DUF1803 domain-containing protein n=1 Tax=Candidatus Enterococcus mangumiae TaxID=2230878 RepID=A0ABZ2SYU9_9ENTE|nr:DUF1803 domain-containing protein [Enterococcus sp. DIV1094]MBO0490603.1 DUF1803 domain-containing protein [Enterococcus sp. DIV1094]
MQYFHSQDDRRKLIAQPLFQPMIDYLISQGTQDIILRQLKKEFPQKKMEHFLDQMIDNGLIIRENRRYRCAFPVYDQKDFREEIAQLTQELMQELLKQPESQRALFLAEEIWHFCRETETDYFYATAFSVPTIERLEAGNENYRFVTLQQENEVSLPTYFHLQKQQTTLPEEFQALGQLIGDVNEAYFFDQVEVIIERVCENKYKKRRESIFLDALLLANVLAHNEQYHLLLPVVDNKKDSLLEERLLAQTSVERAFIKEQALVALMKELEVKSYSYIKKMI